jgi:hypothetical protein
MSLRFSYSTGSSRDATGYPLLVVDGQDTERDGPRGGRRYVSLHRLAAVAWGTLEGLDDHRHLHHHSGVTCETAEGVLSALPPEQHGEHSAAQAQREQRVRGDGGEPA